MDEVEEKISVTIEDLMRELVEKEGSDLHLTAGSPPRIRVHGNLIATDHDILIPHDTQRMIYSILNNDQIARFEQNLELDMSFGIAGLGRFRTNVFMQRGTIGAVLRVIPMEVPDMATLGLPEELCQRLCQLPKGLILVTGPTGTGKSTTQAAMIDYINRTREGHIVTIEDPIEFMHRHKNCLINQREVGNDTRSFPNALRRVFRQDPDVILIGEMRDQETMQAALTLAETGHLTFGTLHTSDVVQTINRIVDVFPAYQQRQVRTQLSFVLEAVFCQQLLMRQDGRGRVLALEAMVINAAIRSLIRDDKAHQIYSIVQTGAKEGMKTLNQAFYELVQKGLITYEDALARSSAPDDLRRIFRR